MSYSGNYNAVDRALHRFAFASPVVQKVLAEVENDLFRKDLAGVKSLHEVFITGLPRAGTTLMLELLYGTGEFQAFTYREMPFILAPLLWSKLSRSFRKAGQKQERAHGDGMEISVDSPEAFDEVIWLTYLGKKIVARDRLVPMSREDVDEEFAEAMHNAVRKLLALAQQSGKAPSEWRYLSKNNANISRIDALPKIFPSSTTLVVFRNPLAHVSSLARQHERFSREHEDDKFSRDYMRWIGHFEFGGNFKPIDFDGSFIDSGIPSRIDKSFWLKYWIAGYSYVLERAADNVVFVNFDALLEEGGSLLERIAGRLAITNRDKLVGAAAHLRAPTTRPADTNEVAKADLDLAQQIHRQLATLAI